MTPSDTAGNNLTAQLVPMRLHSRVSHTKCPCVAPRPGTGRPSPPCPPPPALTGDAHIQQPVQAAGAQQGRIQQVGPVGGADQKHVTRAAALCVCVGGGAPRSKKISAISIRVEQGKVACIS